MIRFCHKLFIFKNIITLESAILARYSRLFSYPFFVFYSFIRIIRLNSWKSKNCEVFLRSLTINFWLCTSESLILLFAHRLFIMSLRTRIKILCLISFSWLRCEFPIFLSWYLTKKSISIFLFLFKILESNIKLFFMNSKRQFGSYSLFEHFIYLDIFRILITKTKLRHHITFLKIFILWNNIILMKSYGNIHVFI